MKRQTKQDWLSSNVATGSKDECWNATGKSYNQKGWHVAFKAEGKRQLAHRASWELHVGPIPDGMCVLHKCDNPKCCNPEHLFLGTQSENAHDMWLKGRAKQGPSTKGIRKGASTARIFTTEDVKSVFSLYAAGFTQKQIANVFGVTDVSVSNILNGKTYPEFAEERSCISHLLGRGKKRKIADYCKRDVDATRQVFKRMRGL